MDISKFILFLIVGILVAQGITLLLIKIKKINEITLHWIDFPWLFLGAITLCLGIYRGDIEKEQNKIVTYENFLDYIFDEIKIKIYDQDYYCRNFHFKSIKFYSNLNNEENNRILCKHIAKIKHQIDINEKKIKYELVSKSNSSEGKLYLSEIKFEKEFVGSEEVKEKYTEALNEINKLSSFEVLSLLKIEKRRLSSALNHEKERSECLYLCFQVLFILLLAVRLSKFTAELRIKKSKQTQEKRPT